MATLDRSNHSVNVHFFFKFSSFFCFNLLPHDYSHALIFAHHSLYTLVTIHPLLGISRFAFFFIRGFITKSRQLFIVAFYYTDMFGFWIIVWAGLSIFMYSTETLRIGRGRDNLQLSIGNLNFDDNFGFLYCPPQPHFLNSLSSFNRVYNDG